MFEITKKDIERLVVDERSDAPVLLAELVRRLVHCTVPLSDISELHFPINIYRPGWDGRLVCKEGNPWVPKGHSFWEYSVKVGSKAKFKKDFSKRTKETPVGLRRKSTFVFVTAQPTPQLEFDKGEWDDVRIYDSEKLFDWLDVPEALSVRVWLANKIGKPTAGLFSADIAWKQWAKSGGKLPIAENLILADREDSVEKIKNFLGENKLVDFLTVYADSKEEATAFVCASLLRTDDAMNKYESRLIVVDDNPENIRTLISPAGGKNLVFLLRTQEMARRIGDLSNQAHIIIAEHIGARTQGQSDESYTKLSSVSRAIFTKILREDMEYRQQHAEQSAQHYGMSVTVFRRHHCAISSPKWVSDNNVDIMVIAALVGGWDSDNEHDRDFMQAISWRKYLEIDNKATLFHNIDDSPIEQVKTIWQIKSRVDALFVLYNDGRITPHTLDVFLRQAHEMLLKPQQEESRKLVFSVMNTLAILFDLSKRFSDNLIKDKIEKTVKPLLESDFWNNALSGNLALLAEAAPEIFLYALNENLNSFGKEEREQQNICWALQVLAWDRRYVDRIIKILLQLIERKNFGIGVLSSFFIPWLPQCDANIASRKKMLDGIVETHPDIGWEICISMLQKNTAVRNSMPRWWDMPPSAEMVVTHKEINEATESAFSHALSLLNNDTDRIVKMIESILRLHHEQISRLVRTIESSDSVKNISPDKPVEIQNALRGVLRRFEDFAAQEKSKEGKEISSKLQKELDSLYRFLSPSDIVLKHLWLFLSDWPDFPQKHNMSINKMEQFLKRERKKSVREILRDKGYDGLWEMYNLNSMMFFVGESLPQRWGDARRFECMLDLVPRFKEHKVSGGFVRSIFSSKMEETPSFVYDFIARGGHKKWAQGTVLAFVLSDFSPTKKLWKMIDRDIPEISRDYWKNIFSQRKKSADDLAYFVRKKIKHGQTHDAILDAAISRFAGLSGKQVAKILKAVPDKKKASNSLGHYIRSAFVYIAQKGDVEEDKVLDLEFQYYRYMGQVRPLGIFRKLALDPGYFIKIMGYLNPDDMDKYQKWYNILSEWRTPPGIRKDGSFCDDDFKKWFSKARALASDDADLLKKMDGYIGSVLVHLPKGDDLPLPEVALEVLDQRDAEKIRDYFEVGIRNSRGVYRKSFGEGGDQEQELAKKYHDIAQKLTKAGYGRVASTYREIAEGYERDAERDDLRAKTNTDW